MSLDAMVNYVMPLRKETNISLHLPRDLTPREVAKIVAFLRTLSIPPAGKKP